MIRQVAILYEDNQPERIFIGDRCIYNAYRYAHHHYCLGDYEPALKQHELPDWLKVTFHLMNESEVNSLLAEAFDRP